jgi:hypothetical protein
MHRHISITWYRSRLSALVVDVEWRIFRRHGKKKLRKACKITLTKSSSEGLYHVV